MKRSELDRKYLKNRTNENRIRYKKQKNFCSKLYKKGRKKFYSNIELKNFTDNKKFEQTISLQIFLDHITTNFTWSFLEYFVPNTTALGDPVDTALEKFKDHLSVKIIKENVSTESLFHFTKISVSEMTKELSSLNSKKAVTFSNIPTKVLKGLCYLQFLKNTKFVRIVLNHY